MKNLRYALLFCIALLSACSSPNQLQSTPSIQVSPSPSMSITSTLKPTSTATASYPTETDSLLSLTPRDAITPSPTLPPAGVFAIKFYPPLVLDYPPEQWLDKSEYDNTVMMANYLQNKELKTCTIGPMGPSGFWPESTIDLKLGSIDYQVQLNQKTTTEDWISYYFAIGAPEGMIDNEAGIVHFFVKSTLTEAKKCRMAAEEVLARLHRAK